jgi:tetratricopeptide (TPR) repeat protein
LAVQLDELINQIQSDQAKQQQNKINEPLTFTTFNHNTTKEKLTVGLNGQFVHSQLLIDCLLQIEPTSDDIDELISICEQEYQGDKDQLALVRKLKDKYSSDRALQWYTKDSFVYRMLNKALRTHNIHLLFLFRFLIRDLEKQLVENRSSSRLTVYRGQLMWKEEFETLEHSIGELISMNSFLSTSLDRQSAYSFLRQPTDLERVLFEIEASPQLHGVKPFANISSFSNYPDEKEVLFMLGSIFRVISIVCDRNAVWTVKLTLCGDHDRDLEMVVNYMKSQIKQGELGLVKLGDVLRDMGKYDEAEKYYRRCFSELQSDDYKNYSICYYSFGRIAESKGDYESSLKWLYKSLEIDMKIMKPDDPSIANTHNSIANIYVTMGDYKQALESYDKALTIYRQAFGDGNPNVATCLNNMGAVYQKEKKYSGALKYYQNALAIRMEHLPRRHPDLGASYNNIGIIHRCLGHSDQALEQYKLALEIYEAALPSGHPDIAMTLENIGIVYEEKRDWKQALSYYEQAGTIYHQALLSTHPDVLQIEQSVKRVSSKLK